jgi:transcription elongation factor GreB
VEELKMGRWRPAQKPGSPYITPDGAKKLKEELLYLWRKLRPEVVKAITAAAAEGDRSENAEYIYRKKQLREIDSRLRYLSKRVDIMKIVDRPPADQSIVRFGARITLQSPEDDSLSYRIVGVDETDAKLGFISIDSPVALALLGKTIGDTAEVELPECRKFLTILTITYF